jgi:Glycosyl transferase family 2
MGAGSFDSDRGPPIEPSTAGHVSEDPRIARLERELKIRDREEQAARREVTRLTEQIARQPGELEAAVARARKLEQTVSVLSVALRRTGADVERALNSRAWRLGHLITRTLSRLAGRPTRTEGALVAALARIDRAQRAVHIDPGPGSPGRAGPPASVSEPWSPERERRLSPAQVQELERARRTLAVKLREHLGPPPGRERWPSVSMIVPTRDGRQNLERLFAGLTEHTRYPALEVVVVDNASTDDTLAYLERAETPFPVHVVDTGENLSFAQANDRGVARATGELLLFLNNDIEPFEEGWLEELVCALES